MDKLEEKNKLLDVVAGDFNYINLNTSDDITLDGSFSLEDLKKMIAIMEND